MNRKDFLYSRELFEFIEVVSILIKDSSLLSSVTDFYDSSSTVEIVCFIDLDSAISS